MAMVGSVSVVATQNAVKVVCCRAGREIAYLPVVSGGVKAELGGGHLGESVSIWRSEETQRLLPLISGDDDLNGGALVTAQGCLNFPLLEEVKKCLGVNHQGGRGVHDAEHGVAVLEVGFMSREMYLAAKVRASAASALPQKRMQPDGVATCMLRFGAHTWPGVGWSGLSTLGETGRYL